MCGSGGDVFGYFGALYHLMIVDIFIQDKEQFRR